MVVAQKVSQGVFNGVRTNELDVLAAETAAYLTTRHPDYEVLAARIAVSNLHKQTDASFVRTAQSLRAYRNPRNGDASPLVSDELVATAVAHADEIERAIYHDRDYHYSFFGFKTLERSYLLKVFLPLPLLSSSLPLPFLPSIFFPFIFFYLRRCVLLFFLQIGRSLCD